MKLDKKSYLRRVERAPGLTLWLGIFFMLLAAGSAAAKEVKTMDVVFTHDIHSYLDGYEVTENDTILEVGGMARLKTFLDQKREENPDTLVVDAGDFSMGTLYHTVFSTEAIEYRLLGQLGFDGTTLGNHEFDFGSEGLASMLNAAAEKEEYLAPLLICNVDWEVENEGTKKVLEAAEKCGLADYRILEKGGVKIALLGVFGKDALICAPTCELTMKDPIESVKKTVAKIKETENVDLIVCLSHSGTWSDPDQSEDELLAAAVPDLDLIISGHTHTVLPEPIIHEDTTIVSCGAYGRYTGSLSMEQNDQGRWTLTDYQLVSMDASIPEDQTMQEQLERFRTHIDAQYLDQFGFSANQILAHNEVEFEPIMDLETEHIEHSLGNLMSDAYRYAVSQLGTGETADVAVVPAGVVRGTYQKGNVTVSDVFDSFSLGSGPDQISGYPLICVYLTGSELRTAAEVDASVSDAMVTARLSMSGLSFSYNPNRIILDKVTDIWMNPEIMSDERIELEPDRLYCVVTDLYTGQMLSAVSDKSMGILKVVPKHADGTTVTDFADSIIYDAQGKELKAWTAIASYFESFPEAADGISAVPSYYSEDHGRKIVQDETGLWNRIKNPGKYAKILYGLVAVMVVLIVFIIVMIVKGVKRVKSRKK